MGQMEEQFLPGEQVPEAARYVCDAGCGHAWVTDVPGSRFPALPEGCTGTGWRISERRNAAPATKDEGILVEEIEQQEVIDRTPG